MNISKRLVLGLGCAWAFPVVLLAGVPTGAVVQHVPGQISYQGVLANPATGLRYADGSYTLDVRIWNSETKKTGCLWGAKYKVAVRDGFFSLMLGDGAAADLEVTDGEMPEFARDELWKALWGENAEDTDRYLGITPHEDARCVPVSVLSELSPRQRLLTSPFAFRAQRAHYAEGSSGDFAVGENLTVEGSATFREGLNALSTDPSSNLTQTFGPVNTTATDVRVGGGTTPTASAPDIYTVGYLLTFRAQGDLTMGSTQGDTVFSIPRTLRAQGAGSLVAVAARNTIGGTGQTTLNGGKVVIQAKNVRYEQTATGVTVSGGTGFTVTSPQTVVESTKATFKGNTAQIQSTSNKYLFAYSNYASGYGKLYWELGGTLDRPIRLCSVSCTVAAGDPFKYFSLASLLGQSLVDRYYWHTCGWYMSSSLMGSGVRVDSNTRLLLEKHHDYKGKSMTFEVYLIGFAKDWCETW